VSYAAAIDSEGCLGREPEKRGGIKDTHKARFKQRAR